MESWEFGDLKHRLRATLLALQHSGHKLAASSSETARQLAEKLAAERFVVVVVGEFKRGKSTFVNALLGTPLLPTAVLPLTSVITSVTYGEQPAATVSFRDGRREVVPPEALPHYVTERGNPANHLGVDGVAVAYPAAWLSNGVIVVDTPGVGSVYAHNTEVAYAFLPQADAAIFLTSADPPISARELEFLSDVRAFAGRMFFVLNKVDHLSSSDRSESLGFTRAVLSEALGCEPTLYPLSARLALEAAVRRDELAEEASGMPAFKRDFQAFLVQEKGRSLLTSVAMAAAKVVSDERNVLTLRQRAAELSVEDLRLRAGEMETLFQQALSQGEDAKALLRRDVDAIVKGIEADLAEFGERASAELAAQARLFLETTRGADRDPDLLDDQVRRLVARAVEEWRVPEESAVAREFDRRMSRTLAGIGEVVGRTVELCAGIMDVQLAAVAAPPILSPQSRFSLGFEKAPSSLDGLLPDLGRWLPRGLARRHLEKELQRRVPELVDRQCGRLRWDFAQRLDETLRTANRELDAMLATTLESLRSGVRQVLVAATTSRGDAVRGEQEAASLQAEFDRIDAQLKTILELTGSGEPRDRRSA